MILGDEPTGNLDSQNSASVVAMFQALAHDDSRAVVCVTHDPAIAAASDVRITMLDGRITAICERLNHYNTLQAVTAERAFLHAMGGGCQSPVAAYAEPVGDSLRMRAVSFLGAVRRGEAKRSIKEAAALGEAMAAELKG